MNFVIFHSTLFEIGISEIEQSISTEHPTYGSIQNVCRFIGECFGRIHILYQMKGQKRIN